MQNNKGQDFKELELYNNNQDITLSKIEYIVKSQIESQLAHAMVNIINTVTSEIGNVDKGIGDLHATMLNAYGTQKFKRDMQKIIDIQLGHKKVRSEHLKDAREFVKSEVFIDGEYQNEKIESSSQYREVSRAIGFAINKCADWRSEWFEDSVSKKETIERKLKEMLRELEE